LEVDAYIDAKAVYDAIIADPVKIPAEKTLFIHLLAAKDYMTRKLIRRLFWIDTNDMLADGLTKGSIDRQALISISSDCRWQLRNRPVFHSVAPPFKNE
jgi:hypothetical protein